jgi:hypothetical protein
MLAAALAVFGSGCAALHSLIPVFGPPQDLAALVGEWHGEYGSSQTGRTGSILFELQAGRDTASGDVVMIPRESRISPARVEPQTMRSARALADVLRIRFVRIEDGKVSGRLDPYRDPENGAALVTTFIGRLRDDTTIEGTFNTQSVAHPLHVGWWKATRVR